MFKNYLKIAWRNFTKNKVFSFLNIIGLSVAFGVAILLTIYSFQELSFDKFHQNSDKLFKTYITWQTPKGTEVGTSQPTPFAPTLKAEVSGISKITRLLEKNTLTIYNEKELNLDAIYVDPDFFKMFSFPITKGNTDNPLENISTTVINEKTAVKIFGDENPVGKIITVLIDGKKETFRVNAVSADIPKYSSIEFEIAIPFEKNPEYKSTLERWNAQYHEVYVQLEDKINQETFENNSRTFTNLHYKSSFEELKRDGAIPNDNGDFLQLGLLPVTDLHFSRYDNGYLEISRAKAYLVLGIAFLILFIACVNFINMSIAKSSQRLKEIGMRKTLGAEKKQLFLQFWGESLIFFIVSIAIGALLSVLLKSNFETLFRTSVAFDVLLSPQILLLTLLLVLFVSLIVGGYPAILLSRLSTLQSLKGKLENSGNNRLRDTLIVLQFGIAILLISGTFVLNGQLSYMRNKDLGFDKKQVLSFPLIGKKNSYDVVKLLREELSSNPNIVSISASDNNIGRGRDGSISTSVWGFGYKGKNVKTHSLVVDYDYIKTLGIELIEGRTFDINRKNDIHSVIINESMVAELNEKKPLSAKFPINDSLSYSVIGVVKDYNFQRVSKQIEPITFFLDREQGLQYAYVKITSSDIAKAYAEIEDAYKQIEPNAAFLGSFLDENVDRTFRKEKTMTSLITSGSIIAIILSCIGLFALSILVIAQRTKEIGVRKVIGASVGSVTYLLIKDFLKLVFIAFIIATPIAWYFSYQWLNNYPYKVALNPLFFIAAGFVTIVISLLTVGGKTIKAAMQNPVNSLKSE